MSRSVAYVVLTAVLAAGCASAPEVAEEAALATPTLAANENGATVVPDAVIDANELVENTAARPICREVLRPNSNVHEKRCMTAQQWKIWDQAEARRAAEIVRMFQGGPFR